MKLLKQIALGTILALGTFSAVLYTSCTKEACKGVTCLNGGSCSGGICSCPTGVGGNNCESAYRKFYTNTYKGTSVENIGIGSTAITNNTLAFSFGSDTMYAKMKMVWTCPGRPTVDMPIVLTTSSASGSNFTITATPVDSFSYSGTGSVNGTTASASIIKTNTNSGYQVVVSLNDFNKQ